MVFVHFCRNKMDPAKRRNEMEGRPERFSGLMGSLCMALADLIQDAAGGEMSRRTYLKLCGLAMAAELYSAEVSGFFGNQEDDGEEGAKASRQKGG